MRSFVERVISSGLLNPTLTVLADRGATPDELEAAPTLPPEFQELLVWRNGLDLDVVRIHGVGDARRRVERVTLPELGEAVKFASDPAGFTYLVRDDGSVACQDHDGGSVEVVAVSVSDFLRGYIFGPRAEKFGGVKWASEVAAALDPTEPGAQADRGPT